MITLRDMRESDIENYVRWFTAETEWIHWDAPWEPIETSVEEERKRWTEYYNAMQDMPGDAVRWKYEIECDGVHIGWICCYQNLEYMENPEGYPAIGLDIPEPVYRGRGYGAEAFRQFIAYLSSHGHRHFYTQTWSGNLPMLRLAEKLGFREVHRVREHREVDNKKYDSVTFRLDLMEEYPARKKA